MDRRDFLKAAGSLVGAVAIKSVFPDFLFAVENAADKIEVAASSIIRPCFAVPSIVKKGNAIPFSVRRDSGYKMVSVWLQPSGKEENIPLKIAKASGETPGALKADKIIPAGIYDLYIKVANADSERTEKQPLSVKIVEGFKSDFVFGVISDVHFGDPRVHAKLPNFDVPEALTKVISELNSREVEFCLACGDFCFTPPKTKNEILSYVNTMAASARFPIFSVPGNHDGYTTGTPQKVNFDTFKYWDRYFGNFDFSATYGDVRIIGLNTYDKNALDRNLYGGQGDKVDTGAMTPEQLTRVENYLKAAKADKSKSVIMLGHQNPTNSVIDVNGPFSVVPFSETGRKELLGLLHKYSPDALFVGHVHGFYQENVGKTRIITAPTLGSIPKNNNPLGYLLVSVKSGKISKVEMVETVKV
ncbi:MAG TPA: metallophosphoesterase [bacterium]|nr:metallophosphoesterase [bacterium]